MRTTVSKKYVSAKSRAWGPRYVHFPAGLPDDYYTQLTAEKLVTRYHKGVARQEWVLPSGARNEAFDCEVYAYAAALRAGIIRAKWEAVERSVLARAARLSAAPPEADKAATDRSRERRLRLPPVIRSQWLNRGA